MNDRQARRGGKNISASEKIQAIDRVHGGESKAAVARHIGVPESTLRGWCKGEEKIRNTVAADTPSPPIVKMPRLDAPLDFSLKKTVSFDSEDKPEILPPLFSTKTVDYVDSWREEGQTADFSSWIFKYCQNYGASQQTLQKIYLQSLMSNHEESQTTEENNVTLTNSMPKKTDDGNRFTDDIDKAPETITDAVYHGQKFLMWLEGCSDPNVTSTQILGFRKLLSNIKDSIQKRHQIRQKRRRKE